MQQWKHARHRVSRHSHDMRTQGSTAGTKAGGVSCMSWQLETGFQSDWDREANSHIFKHLPKKKKKTLKNFL